tara:strand:+ start:316 stop:618 length:303 start_codon:yes stop_codon:yes gene_type:complete
MIDIDKYEGHSTGWKRKINHSTYSIINDDGQKVASVPCYEECNLDSELIADAPLILAAYDKQVRWINDILFRLERMDEASTGQRLRFLLTVQEELEMMIE